MRLTEWTRACSGSGSGCALKAEGEGEVDVAFVIDAVLSVLAAGAAIEVEAHLHAFAVAVIDQRFDVGKVGADRGRPVGIMLRPVDTEAAAFPAFVCPYTDTPAVSRTNGNARDAGGAQSPIPIMS
jgi:hypothetical protein